MEAHITPNSFFRQIPVMTPAEWPGNNGCDILVYFGLHYLTIIKYFMIQII